jgi:hypothetical protein
LLTAEIIADLGPERYQTPRKHGLQADNTQVL